VKKKDPDEACDLVIQTELNTSCKTLQDIRPWKKFTKAKSLPDQGLKMN